MLIRLSMVFGVLHNINNGSGIGNEGRRDGRGGWI